MTPAKKKQQRHPQNLPTNTHESKFIQEQMQRLLKKALVTIETTLNDHNLPSADRLDASLRLVELCQGGLAIPSNTWNSGDLPESKERVSTSIKNKSMALKPVKPSKEELELEELRAVLDHSSSDESALFERDKLSKQELELDELRAVL